MAVLASNERSQIVAALQRWWSNVRETCTFTKPELVAAVDAADAWVDSNAASFNTALPAQFRNKATALQKTLLLTYVALRRVRRDGADLPIPGA